MATTLNPCEQMGLGAEATPDEVRQKYKDLAWTLHPDRGGKSGEFQAWVQLFRKAMDFAHQPRTCKICNGVGRVQSKVSFAALPCQLCGGKGKIILK